MFLRKVVFGEKKRYLTRYYLYNFNIIELLVSTFQVVIAWGRRITVVGLLLGFII